MCHSTVFCLSFMRASFSDLWKTGTHTNLTHYCLFPVPVVFFLLDACLTATSLLAVSVIPSCVFFVIILFLGTQLCLMSNARLIRFFVNFYSFGLGHSLRPSHVFYSFIHCYFVYICSCFLISLDVHCAIVWTNFLFALSPFGIVMF